MEQILTENKRLREKIKTLEAQLEKLRRKHFFILFYLMLINFFFFFFNM